MATCMRENVGSTEQVKFLQKYLDYSHTWVFSEDHRQATIEEVATFVSKVYACFSRLNETERAYLRDKERVWISSLRATSLLDACDQFERKFKDTVVQHVDSEIQESLIKRLHSEGVVHFRTDYGVGDLLEIVESIFPQHVWKAVGFFPCKTHTSISIQRNVICLEMHFKGPYF